MRVFDLLQQFSSAESKGVLLVFQLISHTANRPHITFGRVGLAPELLRRCIDGGALVEGLVELVMDLLRVDFLGASEVDDLDMMVGLQQNVLRLDVPVDDALCIHF